MKIMHLLSSLHHDDDERGVYALSHALHKQGGQAVVVAADGEHPLIQRLEHDGNHYEQLAMPKKSWLALRQIWRLRKLIIHHQPDVIHVHSRVPAWILHFALKKLPKHPKVVASVYGFYALNHYSRALFFADVVVSSSKSIDDYLQKNLANITPNIPPITCIRRGVDTRRYPYRHKPSVHWLQQVFAEFPELEKKQWLIFPTRIGSGQGQEWVIDILGNLSEEFTALHIIVMDVPFLEDEQNNLAYEDFYQRVATLGLLNKISFIGKSPTDLKDWLSSAHIVLALADSPESIGMTVLKALHLGTPVIGWDKGAYHDILSALYPKGLVDDISATALCERVKTQLTTKIRPDISYEYEIETMVCDTMALYHSLIK